MSAMSPEGRLICTTVHTNCQLCFWQEQITCCPKCWLANLHLLVQDEKIKGLLGCPVDTLQWWWLWFICHHTMVQYWMPRPWDSGMVQLHEWM